MSKKSKAEPIVDDDASMMKLVCILYEQVEVSFLSFLELWMKHISRRLAQDFFVPINHRESTRSSCPEMKAGE